MSKSIKNSVAECKTCLQTKNTQKPKAEVKAVFIPEIPREVLSIDIAAMPSLVLKSLLFSNGGYAHKVHCSGTP